MRLFVFIFILVLVVSCKKDDLPKGEDNLFFVEFLKNGDAIRFEDVVDGYGNGHPRIAFI